MKTHFVFVNKFIFHFQPNDCFSAAPCCSD